MNPEMVRRALAGLASVFLSYLDMVDHDFEEGTMHRRLKAYMDELRGMYLNEGPYADKEQIGH